MTPKQFLDLVEVRVVIPSVAPLMVGLAYSQWQYARINWLNAILLIIATVCVHLAVNTFNRYEDNKRQQNNSYLRETVSEATITDKQVLHVAVSLAVIAAIAGISVALLTDYVTWIIGIISFLIGYLYSAGPKPITNTPFGELVSGITMGYFIFVAQLYVNTQIQLSLAILWQWLIVSLPLVILIANIMFANNIADHQEDEENHRHTLVHYLGLSRSKVLYQGLVVLALIEIIVAIILKYAPLPMLVTLLLAPILIQNARTFTKRPIKEETFLLSIKNLVVLMLGMTITLVVAIMM